MPQNLLRVFSFLVCDEMDDLRMTNIEFILTRMMHDPVFAEDVLENPEAALAEYNLPLELVERFKTISRPAFSAMTLESRKSFAQWVDHPAE